ncbi:hypothetical protein GCM10010519_22530 [Streptomyces lactacystinicus]
MPSPCRVSSKAIRPPGTVRYWVLGVMVPFMGSSSGRRCGTSACGPIAIKLRLIALAVKRTAG